MIFVNLILRHEGTKLWHVTTLDENRLVSELRLFSSTCREYIFTHFFIGKSNISVGGGGNMIHEHVIPTIIDIEKSFCACRLVQIVPSQMMHFMLSGINTSHRLQLLNHCFFLLQL